MMEPVQIQWIPAVSSTQQNRKADKTRLHADADDRFEAAGGTGSNLSGLSGRMIQTLEKLDADYTAMQSQARRQYEEQGWMGRSWDFIKNTMGASAQGRSWANPVRWWAFLVNADAGSKSTFGALKETHGQIEQLKKLALQGRSFEVEMLFSKMTGKRMSQVSPQDRTSLFENSALSRKLTDFEESQHTGVDFMADMASGIGAFTAFTVGMAGLLAAPITGGSSLLATAGALGLALGTGAAGKIALKASDAWSGGRRYDSAMYDGLTGGFTGALAPISAGGGSWLASRVAGRFGVEAVAVGVGKGMALDVALSGGSTAGRLGVRAAQLAADGAILGSVDGSFRHGVQTGSTEGMGQAFVTGLVGGMLMSPVLGGAMRAMTHVAARQPHSDYVHPYQVSEALNPEALHIKANAVYDRWKAHQPMPKEYAELLGSVGIATAGDAKGLPSHAAAAYLPVSMKTVMSRERMIMGSMRLDEIASHEGTHGLGGLYRTHLQVQDPALYKQLMRESILSRIEEGESMPLLLAKMGLHPEEEMIPKFKIAPEHDVVFEEHSNKLIMDLMPEKEILTDWQTGRLNEAGRKRVQEGMSPEMRAILKSSVGEPGVDQAGIEVMDYYLHCIERMHPEIIEKAYIPAEMRGPLKQELAFLMNDEAQFVNKPDWQTHSFNEAAKTRLDKLLDKPEARLFLAQFENREQASAALAGYGESIRFRLHLADKITGIPIPPAVREKLAALPMTDAMREEAIQFTKGYMSTIEGNNMAALGGMVPDPKAKLGYAVVAYEERLARTRSYEFQLKETERILDKLKAADPNHPHIAVLERQRQEFLANGRMMGHLEEFVGLQKGLDLAERDPAKLQAIADMRKQIQGRQSEITAVNERISAIEQREEAQLLAAGEIEILRNSEGKEIGRCFSRTPGAEELALRDRIETIQESIGKINRDIAQANQPENLLADNPANRKLVDEYKRVISGIQQAYPQIDGRLRQDLPSLGELAGTAEPAPNPFGKAIGDALAGGKAKVLSLDELMGPG